MLRIASGDTPTESLRDRLTSINLKNSALVGKVCLNLEINPEKKAALLLDFVR